MNRALLFWIKLAITAILLAVLFIYILPLGDFLRLLAQAQAIFVVALLLSQLLRRILAAVQVTALLEQMNDAVRFARVFKAQNLGLFYSFFTPGEVGVSLVTMALLSRETLRTGTVISCLAYIRILRYAALILFAAIGMFFEPRLMEYHIHLYLALLLGLILLGFIFFHSPPIQRAGHRAVGGLLFRLRWPRSLRLNRRLWSAFYQANHIATPALAKVVAAVLLAQLIAVAGFYCAQFALGLDLPWSTAFWLMPAITVLTALPLSISGLGVREISVAALLLALYQTPTELSAALSLLIFGSFAATSVALGVWLSLAGGSSQRRIT